MQKLPLICYDRGIQYLWLELDALVVISILHGKSCGDWSLQHLTSSFVHVDINITHIFLEGNRAADYLANLACFSKSDEQHNFTPDLLGLVETDFKFSNFIFS